MSIPIIPLSNPRIVTLELPNRGRSKGMSGPYSFDIGFSPFLISQGWDLVKSAKQYVHFRPPLGVTKPFLFNLQLPTEEQVEQFADERYAEGKEWIGQFGEWPAHYSIPSPNIWSEKNLFTGAKGPPKEGKPAPPFFSVGYDLFWRAKVTFFETGPMYSEQTTVNQPTLVKKVVKSNTASIASEPPLRPEPEEEEFPEGRVLFRLHRLRERDPAVIELAKKAAMAKTGRVACCVCNFDFGVVYGPLGEDYIEGHHTKPISELEEGATTKVSDISLVCANCHRMLHRKRPWLGVNELQSLLTQEPSTD